MPTPVEVRCEDSPVRQAIAQWIRDGRLDPPVPLRIEVTIAPVAAPDPADARPVFRQPELAIRSGGGDGRVTITWDRWPAEAELTPESGIARVCLSPQAAEHLEDCLRQFMITTLIFLLRRAGWHHVHGATALDPLGRGWLIAGNSGAGKSTTVALLASRGWAVGTDDIAFLANAADGGVEAHAFRTRIALRPGGEALLLKGQGKTLAGRGKVGFWPEELGGRWQARIEPQILLFPTVGNEHTAVQPIRPGQALAELVRWSAWVALEPDLAQDHLELLGRLGTQARAYQVTLGADLFHDPNLPERLIP